MSCEVKQIAQIQDINNCKEFLVERGDRNSENWLQECLVTFSPTGEVLIIAKGPNLIVLTSKWDSAESSDVKMKYNVSWQGKPCCKSGDITAVMCLPLLSHGQSMSGADWTCIIVGFSSGAIKFYTENMHQLISEVLHAEPVTHIKCNSFRMFSPRGSNSTDQEPNESIYVLYKTVICVLNGFSLFQTLRGCRNRLARQSASLQGIALETSLPMDYKKYSFTDQDAITDACFTGQTSVNIFDHLVSASVAGGFYCNYRPSPPQTSLIIATGRKPFLGFHYTVEGGGIAVFADVALAVASKIKESVTASLPGWLGFGSSEQEKMKVSQEPAEQLRCRFGLCDLWRHGSSIITSPNCKLSAITDSLGRIFLIENSSGVARRMWKGYRGAQCGFIETEEDLEKSKHRKFKSRHQNSTIAPRRALFIAIYAPKKGLIEIFTVQQGPCVASFKVSKHGVLIYTPHGLLGFNIMPSKGVNTSQYPVIFVSEDGIKEIIIPFHCGLRNDKSNKARDLHLLKKMKVFLKEDHNDDVKFIDDMKAFAKDLKTDEIKMQVLDMLMGNKQVTAPAFMAVLNEFKENSKAEVSDDVNLSRNFNLLLELLEKLLILYTFLKDLNSKPPNYKTVVEFEEKYYSLAETLLLTNKEVDSILKLIKLINEIKDKEKANARVTFLEKNENVLIRFLSSFDFNSIVSSAAREEKKPFGLPLKADLNDERCNWISEFIFSGIFHSDEWISDWKTYVHDCKLEPIGLMKCLILYWLNKPVTETLNYEIMSLVELLKTICSLVEPEIVSVEYSKESPWWKTVRNYLKSSPCSVAGLLAALACRTVTITMEQVKEMKQTQSGKKHFSESDMQSQEPRDNSSSQNNEWENVSQDTWEWDILIVKLEDVALLNSVLTLSFKNVESSRPKLDFESRELSLQLILSKGDGYISELVAKWLAQFGLEPFSLIDLKDIEFQVKRTGKSAESGTVPKIESVELEIGKAARENETIPIILDYANILKLKFPYSLTSSSLLGNICWEYMACWYKNSNDLSCLQSAVDYLHDIPSTDLKHGLSFLCWTTYVSHKFAAVSKLLNTFGKVPKDKFCTQEVNLTSLQVPVFLRLCTEILNMMLETGTCETKEFVFNQEGLWQNDSIGNVPSLVTLALSQPKINDELLVLHYQLAVALHMVSELNIKFPKLMTSLFDNVAMTEFFVDLSKNSQLSNHSCNAILTQWRKQFLYKVIAGAVQTIEVVESRPLFPVAETEDYVLETRANVEKATKWLSSCFDLARMWDIPLDDLRRQHVCELYSSGFDRLAEEILPAVNECKVLASQLLVLAGQRLKTFIHESSSSSKKLSILSPYLTTWLECLDSESLHNHNVELNDLRTLLSYILKWHPIKADEERLAIAMAESIPSLENETFL